MIAENMVVSMNYTLRDESGNVLDSSEGQPFEFLQGHRNIIPGLEKALTGLVVGTKKTITVPPEEGYGEYNPELKFAVELNQFGGQVPPEGMMVQFATPEGSSFMAEVVSVEEDKVQLDANHPLAGQALVFDVEIMDIRPASTEELAHGHPHGPGGHHHH